MNYQNYTAEDFLLDEKFREWVEKPNRKSDLFWKEFLANHPDKQDEIHSARETLLKMQFRKYKLNPEEVSEVWSGILREKDKVRGSEEENIVPLYPGVEEKSKAGKIFSRKRLTAGIAASISVFLLMAGLYGWWLHRAQEQVYTTAYGETMTIPLADGSIATLNANSSLRVPADWNENDTRKVWLEGEAFFQVRKINQHDPSNLQTPYKFVVHTQGVAVEVLGTQFNVNARREKVQVVLNTGKVRLKWQQQEVLMQPGELVEVSQEGGEISQRVVKPEVYSSWKDNRLLCDTTPLYELAHTIEDRFGYEVVFLNDSLSDIKVSGTIPLDSIETFNLVLSRLIKANFELKGNKVFISK